MGAAHTGGYVSGRINSGASIGETLYAANMHSSNLVKVSVLPHASTDGYGFICPVNMCEREILRIYKELYVKYLTQTVPNTDHWIFKSRY